MAQDDCEHKNAADKKYCPDCGKEMTGELDTLADKVADALLRKMKTEPPDKRQSILDRMKGKK